MEEFGHKMLNYVQISSYIVLAIILRFWPVKYILLGPWAEGVGTYAQQEDVSSKVHLNKCTDRVQLEMFGR